MNGLVYREKKKKKKKGSENEKLNQVFPTRAITVGARPGDEQ